jgi:uroporphyrinogen decarboxylase
VNDLLLRAARGERTGRVPVWLMRQAGRTDPAYRALKAESGLPLEDLFRHPEWAARLSLLPQRIGVDAIIFFQDILTLLAPMGAPFVFAPGPVFERAVRTAGDIDALHGYDVAAELGFVPETFRLIHEALAGELPVLGFAGAPLTLLYFLAEGKSFGHEAPAAQALLEDDPASAHRLLDKLTVMTIDYLKLQVEAGAAALQLFESAAYLLTEQTYREFALPYQQRIFDALRGTVPTIMFAREWNNLEQLGAAGADILSLPSTVTITEARRRLGDGLVVQGNLDNRLLAEGSHEDIAAAARACIADGGRRGHIFNLNHGLLKETPFENVQYLIQVVKETV